ncbi:hypothetical protein PTKIN_Ptkin01aG0035900 [Pterospermum kingtungense]
MGDRFVMSPNRASSLYNLTFDEVQSQLGKIGKPLNAMNLDELVRSVVAVEGGLVQNPSSSSSSSLLLQNFNLNGTLSEKTVDEVWKEIVGHGNVDAMDHHNQFVDQQRLSLGETTLEDFLVRAGVINTGDHQVGVLNPQQFMAIDPMAMVSQQADWLQFQMAVAHQQQQQQQQPHMTMLGSNFNVQESTYENQVVDVGYQESQQAMTMPMPAMSATSSDSQPHTGNKHRYSDVMEKTIERRQKRMIKNRESAARSRARKQAYTDQLELEVDQLRKMNSWLRREKKQEELKPRSGGSFCVPAVQMETKNSYVVELMLNQALLTCAFGTLLLQAQLFSPQFQALVNLLMATQVDNQESYPGTGHESEAVDAEGDGDEDNDDDDGGYGEGEEEDPSDEDGGAADHGNNPNDLNGNSKKGTEGGAGGEDGEEEEEENGHDDDDDGNDDDDDDEEEPEDGDNDDDEDEEEKEGVEDDEPEDEEDEEDEEEPIQPPKKRKK